MAVPGIYDDIIAAEEAKAKSTGIFADIIAEEEKPLETSALGAAGRAAIKGAGPGAAFLTASSAAYPWATGLVAPFTGPFAPLAGGVVAAIPGTIAASIAAWAQSKAADVIAPEAAARFEELEKADTAQHPAAQFAGELASGIAGARLAPGTVLRGGRLLPRVLAGGAADAEKAAVAQAAGQVGGGAVLGAALPVITEGRMPTAKDVGAGAAFAALYGHPYLEPPGAARGAAFLLRRQRPGLSRMAIEEGRASSLSRFKSPPEPLLTGEQNEIRQQIAAPQVPEPQKSQVGLQGMGQGNAEPQGPPGARPPVAAEAPKPGSVSTVNRDAQLEDQWRIEQGKVMGGADRNLAVAPFAEFQKTIEQLPPEVADLFSAHGIVRGPYTADNGGLVRVLRDKIANPFDVWEGEGNLRPRSGDNQNGAWLDAPFVLLSEPSESLSGRPSKNVVVNGPAKAILGELRKEFPGVNFMTSDEAVAWMDSRAKEVKPNETANLEATPAKPAPETVAATPASGAAEVVTAAEKGEKPTVKESLTVAEKPTPIAEAGKKEASPAKAEARTARDNSEQEARNQREAEEALKKPYRYAKGGAGIVEDVTARDMIDDLVKRGFINIVEGKRGAFKTLTLRNADGQGYQFRSKHEMDYAREAVRKLTEPAPAIDKTAKPTKPEGANAGRTATGQPVESPPGLDVRESTGASPGTVSSEPTRPTSGPKIPASPTSGVAPEGQGVVGTRGIRGSTGGDTGTIGAATPERQPAKPGAVPGTAPDTSKPGRGPNDTNHVLPREQDWIPKGDKSKVRANIEAIKLLRKLEAENRNPTPEEKAALAQYTGWGGLKQIFDEGKAAYRTRSYDSLYGDQKTEFDRWEKTWGEPYDEVKSLLTPEEWNRAARSILNAHYTSRKVITAIWDAVQHMGFKGGVALEPAAGVGHFIGLQPQETRGNTKWAAVELDSVSGRIASKLYPEAKHQITGFQSARLPNNSVDLVISNFPFAKEGPSDPRYQDFSLHNYFLARSLDVVKPGGIVAAITSNSTMDSAASRAARQYVSERADLVGAIRLPNDAFKENAGTEVTTDILFFRKRDGTPFKGEPFTRTVQGETYKGEPVELNEYFKDHPEMMLGRMSLEGTMYGGNEPALLPIPGANLQDQLKTAITKLGTQAFGAISGGEAPEGGEAVTAKIGGLSIREGKPVIAQSDGTFETPDWASASAKVVQAKSYIGVRDATKDIIEKMLSTGTTDVEITKSRNDLNRLYDDYTKKYGPISERKSSYLEDDVDFPLVLALEDANSKLVESVSPSGKSISRRLTEWTKSKIFSERTIFPREAPVKVDTISDGYQVSMNFRGKVDPDYIAGLTGKSVDEVKGELLSAGMAFENPKTGNWEPSWKYLSGPVRDKLAEAKKFAEDNPNYQANVSALEKVQPEPIAFENISFRLGSTFIESEIVQRFLRDKFGLNEAKVSFTPETGNWHVESGYSGTREALNTTQYGIHGITADKMVDLALNLKSPTVTKTETRISDTTGKPYEAEVKDSKKTLEAHEKQAQVKRAFIEWAKQDPEAARQIEARYNVTANGSRVPTFEPPTWTHYPNASADITLRDHQKRVVTRMLQDSTLLAHAVGTGKTYAMVTAAMEARRLGLATKPMIVVQNATLEQFARSFKRLYPTAKILAPSAKQRDAVNRQRTMSRIATGDWDAVIIPQSFVNMMPDAPARMRKYIGDQLAEMKQAKIEADAGAGKRSPKAADLQRAIEKLEKRLGELADRAQDNVLNFDQLGVDMMFVDEAHAYKKLQFFTKMENIKGLDVGASQRGFSMLMKVRSIQEKNQGRNVVFATGTPVSNTIAEAWNMMRYLRPDILEHYGMKDFDSFAANFGDTITQLEMTAGGNWKPVTRFARYSNGPELISAWRAVADVVTPEEVNLPGLPALRGGKVAPVVIPQTPLVTAYVAQLRAELEAFDAMPGKEKRENSHIPLVVFGRARKATLDMRLIDSDHPDEPGNKLNRVADEVARIYKESEAVNGTQMIFSDLFQNADGKFNLYEALREKLIKRGVAPDHILIVTDELKEAKREAAFQKLNDGDTRIAIGSTERMGTGINAQEHMVALHHMDAPNRPMDIEQRNGRALRQGNQNPMIDIKSYGVENTLDAALFQRLSMKQKFINQILRGDIKGRQFDDAANEVSLSFDEQMAAFSGDPLALEKVTLENQVRTLEALRSGHFQQIREARESLNRLITKAIPYTESDLARSTEQANRLKVEFADLDNVSVKQGTQSFTNKKDAAKYLDDQFKAIKETANETVIAAHEKDGKNHSYNQKQQGFKIGGLPIDIEVLAGHKTIWVDESKGLTKTIGTAEIHWKIGGTYNGGVVTSGNGFYSSFDSTLKHLISEPGRISQDLASKKREVLQLKSFVEQPFEHEAALQTAQQRYNEVLQKIQGKADSQNVKTEVSPLGMQIERSKPVEAQRQHIIRLMDQIEATKQEMDMPPNYKATLVDALNERLGEIERGMLDEQRKDFTKPSDIANAIADSLENIKAGGHGRTNLSLFGVVPAVWDKAVSIAQAVIRAGGAVADAVAAAISHIRSNHKGAWDEPKATKALQDAVSQPQGVETQIQGSKFRVTSATKSPVDKPAGVASAIQRFNDAGLRNEIGNDGRVHLEDGDGWPPRQAEGVKLLKSLSDAVTEMGTLAQEGAPPNDRNVAFIDSVRHITERMQSMIDRGEETAFEPALVKKLMAIAQGTPSEIGRLLQLFDSGQRDFTTRLRNVDVELELELENKFGGNGIVRTVLLRAMDHFRDFFTDAEITKLTDKDTPLATFFTELMRRVALDRGSYVYRMAHAQMKPQIAKTLKWLEADTIRKEAVNQILENYEKAGGTLPAKKNAKLTPHEQMILLAKPETVAKLDAAIARAVREGERNAAREIIVRDNEPVDLEAYDARTRDETVEGPDPTPEQIEEGFLLPKHAHWKVVRDNLLGYSPVTDALVRKIIAGDFKGTRFENGPTKPQSIKIDLRALAKQPDAEVQRVLDAHAANLETELAGATPAMQQRILRQIRDGVEAQLRDRRQEFLDNFLKPNDARKAIGPSQKLQELLNAGVERDPRFQDEKVRNLVKKLTSIPADEFDQQATRSRTEKNGWIQDKLIETSNREGWGNLAEETRAFFEAVTFTKLAEGLQAAEERIARRFLGGKDINFNRPAAKTPAEMEARQEALKTTLEGIIRAGGFDTALVESAARKSSVQKFTPTLPNIVKQLLETPFFKHEEVAERFANQLVDRFGIDPAQRDKAKAIFLSAFKQKAGIAGQRALAKARESLTPRQRDVIPDGKLLWRKLVEMVNAKGFDSVDALKPVAEANGWQLSEPLMAEMRRLGERDQRLEKELPDATLARMRITREEVREYDTTGKGLTPEQAARLEDERVIQRGGTETERNEIHHKMVALWARMTRPTSITSHEGRRNLTRMANDLSVINILTRWTFGTIQAIDVATQSLAHTVFTATAHAKLRYKQLPKTEQGVLPWLTEQAEAIRESLKLGKSTFGSGYAALSQGIVEGRGLPQRVESIETGMHTFDRSAARAEELMKNPDPVQKVRGFLQWVGTEFLFGRRVTASLDQAQTLPGRTIEFGQMLRTYLRTERGFTKAEAETWAGDIIGDIKSELALASSRAPSVLEANEIKTSKAGLRVAAWNIVWGRMMARARQMGLSEGELANLQSQINKRLQTLSWNRPELSGIGKVLAVPLKGIEEWATNFYIPTAPISSFGNALALGAVQKMSYSPLGFLVKSGLFKGSPTAETALDREVIMSKATFGTAVGAGLAGLVATGAIKVILGWPDDKREREEMAAKGLKPMTAYLPIGDGRYLSASLTAGPLALLSPEIVAGAAVHEINHKKAKQQQKLNEEAARLGLEPGKVPGWNAQDVLHVAGQVAKDLLNSTRTGSGKAGAFSDSGELISNKAIASWISTKVPLLPLFQNTMRLAGVDIDPRMPGAFWDMILPLPSSGSRRVNALGDRMSNFEDLSDKVAMFTRGTGKIVRDVESKPYATLLGSGFSVPADQPGKAYNVNGTLRPLNDGELSRFTVERGRLFKEALTSLGSGADKEAVQAAFKTANAAALASVGGQTATTPRQTPQGGTPRTRTGSRLAIGRRGRRYTGRFGRARTLARGRVRLGRATGRLSRFRSRNVATR